MIWGSALVHELGAYDLERKPGLPEVEQRAALSVVRVWSDPATQTGTELERHYSRAPRKMEKWRLGRGSNDERMARWVICKGNVGKITRMRETKLWR